MSRTTRVIGFIQSQAVNHETITDVQVEALTRAVAENEIAGVIEAGLKDGCIGIDLSAEAAYELNASNYNFAHKIAGVLAAPGVKELDFAGEFIMVTDGYPLPYTMHIGVRNSEIYASQGNIKWGEMVKVETEGRLNGVAI